MIDTDIYEGHNEEEWVITCDDGITWNIHTVSDKHLIESKLHNTVTNLVLMRDAPLLLEEVKRLREAIADVANSMEAADPSLLRSFIKDLLEVIE